MSEIEINNIKNNLEKILNSGKEPIYCEELITSGELKRLLEEIERLNNIIKEVREYHDNCINNSLDLDKIDDNEKLAYKVAYGIHKRYLEILDKGE